MLKKKKKKYPQEKTSPKHTKYIQPENDLRSVSCSTPRGKATAIPALITHIIALQQQRTQTPPEVTTFTFFHGNLGSRLQNTVKP